MRETGCKKDEYNKKETSRKGNGVPGTTLYALAVRPLATPPMVIQDVHDSFWNGQQPG